MGAGESERISERDRWGGIEMIKQYRALDKPFQLDGNTLAGYTVVYNSESRNLGGYVEVVRPGAFMESLRSGTVTAVLDHDDSKPLGTQENGTLKLRDDEIGIHATIELPEVSYVADMRTLMARGDYGGMSINFGERHQDMRFIRSKGKVLKEVTRGTLLHVSPVLMPAYADTTVSLRSLVKAGDEVMSAAELYGLDLEVLARALVAMKKGLPLEEAEREIAQQAMSLLSKSSCPNLEAAEDRAARVLL